MISRLAERLVLRPADLSPRIPGFEVIGVFNPGAVQHGDEVVLMARIAEAPVEKRAGAVGLPRWTADGPVVDWTATDDVTYADPRVVHRKVDGVARLTFVSYLQVFRGSDAVAGPFRAGPAFLPESPYEEYGVEDPRITRIGSRYWITYVAVSRHGAATALASTSDFETFERHGIIFCPENKDVVLFPEQMGGKYFALHRPNPNTQFCLPEMWVASSPDLIHWGEHRPLMGGATAWESNRIGAGCPPIAVDGGWLEIYHGSQRAARPGEVGAYSCGALLLDRADPTRILRRSRTPILTPSADFERAGFIDNVIFPTGVVGRPETLLIYYGASDAFVGVVEISRAELLASMSARET